MENHQVNEIIKMLEDDLLKVRAFDDYAERSGFLQGTVTNALSRLYAAQRAAVREHVA